MKYMPKQQKLEQKHYLQGQPGRDHQAMILPLAAIRVLKNDRILVDGVDELAASIAQHGLLQPLVVRKANGHFELIAGHRRYLALQKLGRKEASVRIENVTEEISNVLRLVENLFRNNLSGWETCKAVHSLLPQFETQAQLAEAIQKDKGYVSKCLAVVRAAPEVERVQHLSLRELFNIYGSEEKRSAPRAPSGPVAGGRYGAQGCLTFNERKDGKAFSLRLNVDFERTPSESRTQIIKTLENILKKLKA
ncbi:MAG: ParB/RepB/Spo0J family partition protein [Bdellovibrionaceae bacterium]|nr:ParB/RepB/Spo0J family partition protein [Pseudobdellovibrionaceae bacterium]